MATFLKNVMEFKVTKMFIVIEEEISKCGS